jgi:D-aspartate ligase
MKSTSRFGLPPVVLLGLSATAVGAARILTARGVPVFGTDPDRGTPGRFSKHIRRPDFGYFDEPPTLIDDLIAFSRRFDAKPVLVAASDSHLELIGAAFDALEPHFRIPSCYRPAAAAPFLNKKSFYALCAKHGVALPRMMSLDGGESADDILDAVRLPLIIKPALIHHWKKKLRGRKVILVETRPSLARLLAEEGEFLRASLAQEVIPGPETNLVIYKGYFREADGRCAGEFTGRKIRQFPPGFGSASFAVSEDHEEVRRLSREFLLACGFRGLCGSEYKFDPRDRAYKMIEINIRPQLWEDLTRVAGRDLVWAAYCDLIGREFAYAGPQKNGAVWSYFQRDLFSAFFAMRRGDLSPGRFLSDYRHVDTDAVFDWTDVRGSIGAPWTLLRQIIAFQRAG